MLSPYVETLIYRVHAGTPRNASVIELDSWTYAELCGKARLTEEQRGVFLSKEKYVYAGGWQSWSAGWELAGDEDLPRKVRLLPDLIKLTACETDAPRKDEVMGHFFLYVRAENSYLCLASRVYRADNSVLPPVSFRINRKKERISAEIFCAGKRWAEGETMAELSVFFCEGYFALKDAVAGLYKQDFSKINFLKGKNNRLGGYESWYNHYAKISEKLIMENLSAISASENIVKSLFIDQKEPAVFQIDDGWEQHVGEWETNSAKFPQGMRFLAEKIEENGLIPGIWLAPFIITKKSRVFLEKPEWLLRDADGKPERMGFNHLWDGHYFCLDLSREDALAYLRGLIDKVIGWGFRYIKLDFLYAGFFSGNFAEGGSPFEHYERAISLLTERTADERGRPVAYLGCGAPLGPSFRHFPLMRIGADTREEWDWNLAKMLGHTGRPSAYISLLDTIGRSFFDNTLFCNDPDVIFLRRQNCKLSEQEKELIALVNFLLAGQIMCSDDPLSLKKSDRALTSRVFRLFETLAGDEYGAVRIDRDVFRLISRSGKIGGIINLSSRPYRSPENFSPTQWLVDHRVRGAFKPHSISLFF